MFKILPIILVLLSSCADYSRPIPGRDKQGAGLISGALLGAGSGALTGAKYSSTMGPGMWMGAGVGAMWGALQGLGLDLLEEEDLKILQEVALTQDEVWAQYALLEHYETKRDLYPGRDIFPADVLFEGSSVNLNSKGEAIVQGMVQALSEKYPSSRVEITVYQVSKDKNSAFASFLGRRRGNAIARALVKIGFEPRRMVMKSLLLDQPLVIDPYDSPDRYLQAVEFALLDI